MTHLDDGALLRFLDGDTSTDNIGDVQEHLDGCRACRAALEEVRRTMATVGKALERTDFTVPTRRKIMLTRTPLAAAATVLLGVAVCFTPLRAWVVERARLMWGGDRVSDAQPPVVQHTPPAPDLSAGSVSFIPASDTFLLEVTERQEAGTVTIEIGDRETATATINGVVEDETLMVLPSGLRIVNSSTSSTTYVLFLPTDVSRINVIVAGEPVVVLNPTEAQREWTIPLRKR